MGVVVGLLLGAGVFCVWWSFWTPAPRPAGRVTWQMRTRDLLTQAGAPSVTPTMLVGACAALGLVSLLLGLALTRSPAIAACFAVLTAPGPVVLVRARARRHRRALREVWPEVVDHLASGVRAGSPCRRRWRSSGSADRPSCVSSSDASPRTTGPAAGSGTRSTHSRSASPTRSPTA